MNPEKEKGEFIRATTAFCQEFALDHRNLWRAHQQGGCLRRYPKDEDLGSFSTSLDPNTTVNLPENEEKVALSDLKQGPKKYRRAVLKIYWEKGVWRNVSREHCLPAGIYGDILCELLDINGKKRRNVVEALLIHDWDKPRATLTTRRQQQEETFSYQAHEATEALSAKDLSTMGINKEIVELVDEITPSTEDGPLTLEGKIVWFVDAMLSNSEPVPIRQRFSDLLRGWDGEKEDPRRAARSQALDNAYKEKFPKGIFAVQVEIGQRISGEFAQMIGFDGDPELLPLYLKRHFEKRIREYSRKE